MQENCGITNEGSREKPEEETSVLNDVESSTISTSREFIKTGQDLAKDYPGMDTTLVGDNLELVPRAEKDVLINNERLESFVGELDVIKTKENDLDCLQKAKKLQEMPQDDDDLCFSQSHESICTEQPKEKISETAIESGSETIGHMIAERDPKDKALRYFEESGVLRMFQNLAAGIVDDRPENPLLYTIKTLQRAQADEECEES